MTTCAICNGSNDLFTCKRCERDICVYCTSNNPFNIVLCLDCHKDFRKIFTAWLEMKIGASS